ncbi:E3 ubiquitin-protein ligase RGLG2 [Beta vulgaris subsp. vulgaris]|uniref:E3 ubiquitin-protein ligase RGLG2 n=1 Tax=Beta vulgaris subsp. vulgaris TaxID=3555 RepID=UPI0020375609|nr:E3 ubiquitin-protein ligase RGLG2 [Beta vulgaris subsp. vulgaris]XP_048502300.1 E3 ubiquitin-protein ligase RGLG2 [Beta vulgaris subsp. vulgaris]
MGGNSSKDESWRTNSTSQSPQWNEYGNNEQGGYAQPYYAPPPPAEGHYYVPSQQHNQPMPPAPGPSYGAGVQQTHDHKKRFERMYSRIADEYTSLDQVTQALARAGLESSNLIVGIDFTKSNEWTGAKSFNKRSLHHIGDGLNPYEQAISIIGKTLATFDDDNLIPCYGFGDASTHDQDVFSFYPDESVCNGFEEVLYKYREIVPHLRLAGPTSFAPVIEMAMTIVERSGGQYHVLLIIADGQVTRSVDTERGRLSSQEQKTVDAIVEASKYPLSIVVVGVGDGPWDMMKEFDDNIPARDFDNFQFVNFTEIMAKNTHQTRKETEFALSALMEIPSQYKATMELSLVGRRRGVSPDRVPLPPPVYNARPLSNASSFNSPKPYHSTSFQSSAPSYYEKHSQVGTAPPVPSSTHDLGQPAATSDYDNLLCPICFTNNKDMAFGCGHQTCAECGQDLSNCPICRSTIQTRIKLY